ncbi:HTH-type transcriptional activator IlvY [bacterium]|jgi:LysR family transcriptional regulator, positive regulator for ilvC|nr:HTH-type transcriptional activator IlvY [bacterium]
MTIQNFKIFLDLAKTLHFGKTSRNQFITPATLTRLIQRLEQEVGSPLFERDNRSVSLTTSGYLFRDYCIRQIEDWESLQSNLNGAETQLTGIVRVYCSVTSSHSILSQLLTPIKEKHPGLIISLETGPSDKTFQKLLNYDADIGLSAFPKVIPPDIQTSIMKTIPLSLIVPKGHNLLDIKNKKLPFIYPKKSLAKQNVNDWFEKERLSPLIYPEGSGFEGIMTLVSLGYGASVVPDLIVKTSPLVRKIDVLTLPHEINPLTMGICCKQKPILSQTVSFFMKSVIPTD